MSWKVIKKGLFVTMEGREKEVGDKKCHDFLFKEYKKSDKGGDIKKFHDFLFEECKKFSPIECYDYWSACWERFRVKFFNKVKYEGYFYYDADYVYDNYEMIGLLIIAGVLLSVTIILILNFFPNI